MDILVVCENKEREISLYYRYIRYFGIPVSRLQKHRHEVISTDGLMQFVSSDKIDIYTQGRHDAKIISGLDFESWLDKVERLDGKGEKNARQGL